jgi:hypothetical protein
MAPRDILRKLKATPFQPFSVDISDGASYDIVEPIHAYVALTEFAVGIEVDETGVPTRSIYIAPNHVTRIEPINGASARAQ